jgi:enolase
MAVAFGCELLKTGIVGGERIAKLNELIRIGEDIGSDRMTENLP